MSDFTKRRIRRFHDSPQYRALQWISAIVLIGLLCFLLVYSSKHEKFSPDLSRSKEICQQYKSSSIDGVIEDVFIYYKGKWCIEVSTETHLWSLGTQISGRDSLDKLIYKGDRFSKEPGSLIFSINGQQIPYFSNSLCSCDSSLLKYGVRKIPQ